MGNEQTYELTINNIIKNGEERKQKYFDSYLYNKRWRRIDFSNSIKSVVEAVLFCGVSYIANNKDMKYTSMLCGSIAFSFVLLSCHTFMSTIKDGRKMKLDKKNMTLVDKEMNEEVETIKKLYKEKR